MWNEWGARLLALLLATPAGVRAGPETPPPIVVSPPPVAAPSAATSVPVKAPTARTAPAAPRRAPRPQATFVPSEKINAGVAVAFPVDI